ncbi:MAG TPA: hypothetical protein DEQ38_00635 [Elusimicrobia bacterium]|nr:MAG: hypothetical protein A2089_05185 [Elusimicrobia bacterium GWD2_63_28]HCC46619.1 hypothetical protein [Elusimicrobiota bacterium]
MAEGMKKKYYFPDTVGIQALAAVCCSRALACRPCARRKGQATVEYLLMLAVVVGVTLMFGVLFHKRILGGIFTIVGLIIGAGTPK